MRSVGFAIVVLAVAACSDTSGCGTEPLPNGALPADQTIEGGAQIRVTRQGFNKLTAVVPGLINAQIANGFCVPKGRQFSVDYCYTTQGQCNPGCKVNVGLNSTTFRATNSQTLTVAIDVNIQATVPTDAPFFSPCNIFVNGPSARGDADIEMTTDVATGELRVRLARIRNVDLSDVAFTGSGGFCSGASSFADFLKDYFAQEIVDYFTPRLNTLIQRYIPNPLGIEGLIDGTPLLASISPGSKGTLEARIVPGGFVTLDSNAQGLSLGVITGINADEDIATRSAALDSEPALCVPPLVAPNFGAPPHSLPLTARSTYRLPAAPAFSGMPEPLNSDLSVGLSETTLDLIGHHAVTSGLMCLGIGTHAVPQLNVGTFGILVPSVADLGSDDGNDPLLLVTRPQRAVDFTIGDNTPQSPAITVNLQNFEIDVYPFLYERYVRAFTMSATLAVGINFEFDHPTGSPWRLLPTLVGLSASQVQITVLNNQFVAESKAQLESTLPTVFDLLASQIAIPAVELPTFAGFNIVNPRIGRVVTPQDDFLALDATLQVGAALQAFVDSDHVKSTILERADREPAAARATGTAKLRAISTPGPDAIRAALAGAAGGALPAVTFDVDAVDAQGRPLEWSWRIDNGLWRPYSTVRPLVIADRAFAWQGKRTIGLMSRVRGEPATASAELAVPVVIDSVGPRLVTSKLAWDGDTLSVAGWDVVGGRAVHIGFGSPGDAAPRTGWQADGLATIDRTALAALAVDGEVAAFLEDPTGNLTVQLFQPFHGQPSDAGCACDAGAGVPRGTLVLALLAFVGLVRPRRRRAR